MEAPVLSHPADFPLIAGDQPLYITVVAQHAEHCTDRCGADNSHRRTGDPKKDHRRYTGHHAGQGHDLRHRQHSQKNDQRHNKHPDSQTAADPQGK